MRRVKVSINDECVHGNVEQETFDTKKQFKEKNRKMFCPDCNKVLPWVQVILDK